MIKSLLTGGIGNLLFQVSTGYSLAKKLNTDYVIDYNEKTLRNELVHHQAYKNNLFKKIKPLEFKHKFKRYQQQGYKYNPIPLIDNLELLGFWHSEKFFFEYEKEIRSLYEFPERITKKVDLKLEKIRKKKLGIHIRDFKHHFALFPNLPKIFYDLALKKFNLDEYELIIITDNIEKVKSLYDMNKFIFLYNDDELEDLYTMSKCDSLIISNSTFAWWGAWLGRKNRKIIVPPIWFGNAGPIDTQDLIPSRWEILS